MNRDFSKPYANDGKVVEIIFNNNFIRNRVDSMQMQEDMLLNDENLNKDTPGK